MSDQLAVLQTEESIKQIKKLRAELPGLTSDVKDLSTSVNNFNRNLRSGNLQKYTEAMQNLTSISKQFKDVQQQVSKQMEQMSRIERNNAQAAAENARARAETARALNEESRARQQVARESANEEKKNKESSSAYARLKKEVRDTTARSRDYGAEIVELKRKKQAGTISNEAYRRKMKELSKDFASSTKEALKLQKEIDKLNKSTSAYMQKNGSLKGRVTDVLKAMGIGNVVDNVASSFYKWGQKAVETSMKLDTLHLSQKAVFKTSEEVNRQNEFLTKTANRYGIEILGLSDAYTKFAASAQGTYLEGKRTQDIFDAVSRSSALLGVSSDETNGILRALGQMMSKGKVQAEELRGQLGDRMAGAFKLFADGMGVSTAELDKMLKKGEVLADDVLPKFAAQLNKKYTLGIGEEIETQAAATNRAANAWVAFVDGINSSSGTITKGVIGFSAALTTMLEALTPSKKVTIIEEEQSQLNYLGYQLRENWKDEKKRKDILDEMIRINPFLVNGLDKEKASLKDVTDQLQKVNDQYIYKIALQQQEEKIQEIAKDQAQAYIYLARIYRENAVEYNNLNEATKKVLKDFEQGTISYTEARMRIGKNTSALSKENRTAVNMLYQLNTVVNEASLNFDGYNRGIRGNSAALAEQSKMYDIIKGKVQDLIKTNGQLVYMNGLTAKSFDKMGKEQQNTWIRFAEDAKKATLAGEKFFLFNNQWRAQNAKGGWFSTGKKGEDWYLEDGKLKQRMKTVIPPEEKKPKAATLTAAQKDQMNIFQAQRDTELAVLTQKQNEGLINEQQFQEKRISIIKAYAANVSNFLKGNNAKEKQVEGAAILRASSEIKSALKEQYDYFEKQSEQSYKKTQNVLDRQYKELEKSDYLSDSERLEKQIELDNISLQKATEYYQEQIKIAIEFHQDTLALEAKRDDAIGSIEDARTDRLRSRFEMYSKDLEVQTALALSTSNLGFEEQRSLILSDKKLTNSEKEYRLSLLEIDKQIAYNKIEIERLENLKTKYDLQVAMAELSGKENPKAKQNLKEVTEQIQALTNANKELNKESIDNQNAKLLEKLASLKDLIGNGLSDLGLDKVSKQFDDLFDKIATGAFTTRDAVVLAASAIADGLTAINNKSKENTIKNLDEQLKKSQQTADQEIGFINKRLEWLNNLDSLSKEQIDERNKLENEARTFKDQQFQREKIIEAQKARAEQRAASQQALINGGLAATITLAKLGIPAGLVPAGIALAFGVAQSIAISARKPIPEYWVGTMNAKPGLAWRDERGAEIHTDKNDVIKSYGDNTGAKLVHMEAGDKVYTADQTKNILRNYKELPKPGSKLLRNAALKALRGPVVNLTVQNKSVDYPEAIAKKVGEEVARQLSRFDKPSQIRINGVIYTYRGAQYPQITGYYDPNTGLEISKEQYLKIKDDSN